MTVDKLSVKQVKAEPLVLTFDLLTFDQRRVLARLDPAQFSWFWCFCDISLDPWRRFPSE